MRTHEVRTIIQTRSGAARPTRSAPARRGFGLLAALACMAASCSGGDGASSPSVTSGAPDPVTTSPPDATGESPSTAVATTSTTTTTATASTTTVPSAEPYRAGVVFEEAVEVLAARPGVGTFDTRRFEAVGDDGELWVLAQQWNTTIAARSSDDGRSWSEVSFGPPPETGLTYVRHLVRGPDGRYVAIADRETSCRAAAPGTVPICTRRRPLAMVSDDGETWTESAPAGLTPPDGSSLRIDDLVVVGDGYLAAGTIEGPRWRAVLYSSPDGLSWTAEREFVGDGNAMSSRSVAHDGTTLVFTADESPCTTPDDNVGGWQLGAGYATHGRIFVGSDIESLTLQQAGTHPLAVPPLDIPPGCGVIDDIPVAFYPYPSFTAGMVGDTLTIFEQHAPHEQTVALEAAEEADDDELVDELRSTLGTRRWARLVDGEWLLADIAGVNVRELSLSAGRNFEVAVAGRPASIQVRSAGIPMHEVFTITEDDPPQVVSIEPIVLARAIGAIALDDGYLVLGVRAVDPFAEYQRGDPASIVAYRTTAGVGSPAGRCELVPDGVCRFADLSAHPDYPDFAGRDLVGVDLTGTDIGSADFSGADLTGARLWLVTSDGREPPSFVDAVLTDAELQRSEPGDISGATVDGASFVDARIRRAEGVDFSAAVMLDVTIGDLTGVTFGGADLTGARLDIVDTLPDLAALDYRTIQIAVSLSADGPFVFDFSDLDLTGVTFSGPLVGDDLAVITSLDGAVLADTVLRYVDLTMIDPATDLSEVRFDTQSICPDGRPPDGLPRSCVREE